MSDEFWLDWTIELYFVRKKKSKVITFNNREKIENRF